MFRFGSPRFLGVLGGVALSTVFLACATRLPTSTAGLQMQGTTMATYSQVSRAWLTEQGFRIEADEVTCSQGAYYDADGGFMVPGRQSCSEEILATRGDRRVFVSVDDGGIKATSPNTDMQGLLDELAAHVQAAVNQQHH